MAETSSKDSKEELLKQIINLDQQIEKEDATARVNVTTHPEVARLALRRKRILENQKRGTVDTLKALEICQGITSGDDIDDEQLDEHVDNLMQLARSAYENERQKQRDIVAASKSIVANQDTGSFLLFALGAVCLGVVIYVAKRNH